MRDLKFRGLSKNGWVYGCPVKDKDGEMLFFTGEYFLGGHYVQYESIEVDPETIGQFTGLLDKNGKEMFDRDIRKGMHDYGPAGFRVEIAPILFDIRHGYRWPYWDLATVGVGGNMCENMEFLDGRESIS